MTPTPHLLAAFREGLLSWYDRVARDLPWRRTGDPYAVWISEVMLQQTRVDQAAPYFERFMARFPTVADLAQASLNDVLHAWEGLGYYTRARNLHRAAQRVVEAHGGRLPATYDGLRALPGIGPYTAAAVASIAFGLPHAVLDGNVVRVLARVLAVEDPAAAAATRRRLQETADALLPPERPADFNQALMELGATVCTPAAPRCPSCPLAGVCEARRQGRPEAFPVVPRKAPIPHHDVAIGLVFDAEGRLLIQQRPPEGLLGGLWEFPGGKREPGESLEAACLRELREELGISVEVVAPFLQLDHAYTHFKITLHAFLCRIRAGRPHSDRSLPLAWVAPDDLHRYAFPRANRRVIEALLARSRVPSLFDPPA